MSELAKMVGKSKLGSSRAPSIDTNEGEQQQQRQQRQQRRPTEDNSSPASSESSTGTVVPLSLQASSAPGPAAAHVDWTLYFAQEMYLDDRDNVTGQTAQYHVYVTPPATSKTPLLVLHHGAGSTALTWAPFVQEARRLMPDLGVLAVDAREHGSVVHDAGGRVDAVMTVANLSADLARMVQLTFARLGWPRERQLLLVGHSLGGAVVVDAANRGVLRAASVLGFAVLDVVEGSAMDALRHMGDYLATRPSSFSSVDAAVDWHVRSRTLRRRESARISVPSLLRTLDSGRWTWKTDLARTEPYWANWFSGMSTKFLTTTGAKLLLLAGTDRLDKELMIGQMQGKFQLQVFPMAGHFIQEDVPDQCAQTVIEFLQRNDRSELVLPPKVSDLLAQGKKV